MSLLDNALELVRQGFAVFPLVPNAKDPLTDHGFKDASRDEERVRSWWSKNPEANIGIATGHYSDNLVVIDIDVKKDAGGAESWAEWLDKNYAFIPETPAVLTWSGGRHLYFKSITKVPCRVGWLKGVDIRAEGGYVVAAGSVINGEVYEWAISPDDLDIVSEDEDPQVSALFDEIRDGNQNSSSSFQMSGTINEGKRNDTLYKFACYMQGKGASNEAISAAVHAENKSKCVPPLPDDEVDTLIKSALTKPKGPSITEGTQMSSPPQINTPTAPKDFDFAIMKHYSARDLMDMDVPDPVKYVGVNSEIPLLSEGTCVLAAKAKAGKSWFCTNLCWALAAGKDFLGFKTKRCKVQYYDLEQGKNIEKKRISMIAKSIGEDPPDGFFMNTRLQRIGHGLIEQLEYDIQTNPDIGVFIIDVFEKVRTEKKQTENDYTYTYRDFGPMNAFAEKYHVAIILLFHSRKTIDPTDPFADILGSTAIQGASTQMIVLTKDKYNSKNTKLISKGRTMDGIVEMEYYLEKGVCHPAEGNDGSPMNDELNEFLESEIRTAIRMYMAKTDHWKGRCSGLINEMVREGIGIDADALSVGRFLGKNAGRLMKHDGIQVQTIQNGSGSKLYTLSKIDAQPLITVDEETINVDDIPFKSL